MTFSGLLTEILLRISGSFRFRSCTPISAYAVLRAWREALLVDDTFGHVSFSISMVKTAVGKVMVDDIEGLDRRTEPWRRWSQPGEKIAQQRYKDMEASEGKFFELEHCWELLENRDKWKLIDRESPLKRGSFRDMDEDENDDGPRNLNKPDGDKKIKEKIKREHEASSLWDKIDAMVQSNEVLLAKSLEAKIELADKKAREKQERWKLLKGVHERRARAAENKTMANLLAEDNRIMTLNRNDMDDISKE
ncbi:Lactation elevated protein 1 [Hordeum vulgare]|nr:Lactation elevated protein 1 [Hordeum vulgare]